jgi:multidrug resistance efflux pump
MNTVLQVLTLTLLAGQVSSDNRPAPGELRLNHSMVSLIRYQSLPARQAGVIRELALEDGTLVQEGLTVKKGQILGSLDDEDALARQRAAETEQKVAVAEKHKAQAGIAAAKATVKVAAAEVAESKDINLRAPGSVPQTQVRRQVLTEERAASESEVAERELETATLMIDAKQAQYDVASITLKHHQIEAAQDGVIVQVYRRLGEWVQPGDSILRIVYMDKLRVEGFVDADAYTADEIAGREVEVTARLPNGRVEKFRSVISFVDELVDSSGDFRVWCDVENRQHNGHWILRPGKDVEMSIKLGAVPSKIATNN